MRCLSRHPPCCPWSRCHPASHLARRCGPGLKTSAFMKNSNCAGTSSAGEASTDAESWRKRCLSLCWQIWSVSLSVQGGLHRSEMFLYIYVTFLLTDFVRFEIIFRLFALFNLKYVVALKVRERREKTRLRVARWRAKRKLQACLNQAQVSKDCSL